MKLSIQRAARDFPSQIGAIVEGRSYTYEELAHLTSEVSDGFPSKQSGRGKAMDSGVTIGRPDLPTLIQIYAHFEKRLPLMLLHPGWTREEREKAIDDLPIPRFGRGNERPAAIVQTSGTTRESKGVILSRRAFFASAAASAANLGWKKRDRWLLNMPVAHIGGLSVITRSLIARRPVVVENCSDSASIIQAVEEHGITLLSLVPTMLSRLLRDSPDWVPPRQVRAILVGGAPFPKDLHRKALHRGFPVIPTYGMTEACSQIATGRPGKSLFAGRGAPPLDNVELRINDGHVEIRGAMLMSGYLRSAKCVLPVEGDGWFRTGDMGRLDKAGHLHILGRREEMIISGGENISVPEVEEVLLRLPGIREVCVFGAPDPEWGEMVCAAIVPDPGETPDLTKAKPLIDECLASYKRPRKYILLEAIPQLASGAPDRKALVRLTTA